MVKLTALIFTRRDDKIRPISCRPMRKNEWMLYEEIIEKDLGNDIAKSRSAIVIKSRTRQMPSSISLDPSLIAKLKEKAKQRGIGYQTMLSREKINEVYLILLNHSLHASYV